MTNPVFNYPKISFSHKPAKVRFLNKPQAIPRHWPIINHFVDEPEATGAALALSPNISSSGAGDVAASILVFSGDKIIISPCCINLCCFMVSIVRHRFLQ